MTQTSRVGCACGLVRIEIEKAPIVSAECHCESCRTAGAKLRDRGAAMTLLEENGGTRFVLYRKDRVRIEADAGLLRAFRLTAASKTRRILAACCDTPLFLEFQGGHWLSLYGRLWPEGSLPPLDLRTMTSDLPDASILPDDVPNGKRQSLSFFAKLLGAWIAMGFRSPKVAVGHEDILEGSTGPLPRASTA